MSKKRGRRGTSVKVKGHYVHRDGKRVHIKLHTRKKPRKRNAK